MRWVVLVVVLVAAALCAPVQAATIHQPSLHVYMTGKKVKGLQWLLTGRRPSHYKGVRTYKGKRTGRYDKKTRFAVKRAKYKLGWPTTLLNGKVAGPFFFAVLKGKVVRPIEWVGIAGQRHKAEVDRSRPPPCVTRMLDAARSQLGVRETSTNYSSTIANYQRITGAYHAAWCVSFAQWANVKAGIGPIADRSAGVNYVYVWAQHRGWVRSIPKVGAWVAFGYSHSTHMGLVERVNSDGSFYTIEGNHNNGVYRVLRGAHENYPVFLWQPCITRRSP
jgi:CHAP domain-containing protein